MKGQTKEIMDFVIIIVGVSIMLIMSYFLFGSKTPHITSISIEQHQYARTLDTVTNIFYTRIPGIDKVLAQMLGDLIVSGKDGIVDYGDRYGGINVTKIVYENFDAYFDKNWNLKIIYEDKKLEFGYSVPLGKRTRTFIMKLPLPSFEGESINAEFKNW